MKPKTLILKTAGINCDEELRHGFELAGSVAEIIHINELVRGERSLGEFDIIGFPGGFSYGDDLSAGRVLSTEFMAHLKNDLLSFYNRGGLIIGICNGFQMLVKAGILPDPVNLAADPDNAAKATLFWNDSGKLEDRWVTLRVEPNTKCVWTKGYSRLIEFPIAHAEGKFIPKSDGLIKSLNENGQIVFRYTDPRAPDICEREMVPYPINPNQSTDNIAGICDPSGRVLGLMPHPERFLYVENHPRWTRRRESSSVGLPISEWDVEGTPDGLPLFKNAVEYVKQTKMAEV